MIKQISSKQNPIIKDAVKLADSKYAQAQGLFKVEGFHNLEMALLAGAVKTVFATKPVDSLPENIEQIIITEEILSKLKLDLGSKIYYLVRKADLYLIINECFTDFN